MVKTLSQIVATILSVEAAFMAAFLVFLFTAQANLDEKIKEEGIQIARILRDPPTTKLSVFVDGYKILEEYKEKYPNESRISLLNKMVSKTIQQFLLSEKSPDQSLLENKASTSPEVGRAYIWIIEEYMDYLSGNMHWRKVGSLGSGDVESKFNYKAEPFPYGLKDTVKWSNEFLVIMNAYGWLYVDREHFLSIFEEYLRQPQNRQLKRNVSNMNYKQWMKETKEWFAQIEDHNSRVQSFLTLKELHSVKMRLPHLGKINFYMIVSFLVGVIYPLFLLSIGKREDDLSKTTNIAILFSVIYLLTAGVYFLIIDIHGYFVV